MSQRDLVYASESDLGVFLRTYCSHQQAQKVHKLQNWVKKSCEFCKVEVNGEKEWGMHIGTRKHKNRLRKQQEDGHTRKQCSKEKKGDPGEVKDDCLDSGLFFPEDQAD